MLLNLENLEMILFCSKNTECLLSLPKETGKVYFWYVLRGQEAL